MMNVQEILLDYLQSFQLYFINIFTQNEQAAWDSGKNTGLGIKNQSAINWLCDLR